jgi:hypothetical protein
VIDETGTLTGAAFAAHVQDVAAGFAIEDHKLNAAQSALSQVAGFGTPGALLHGSTGGSHQPQPK